MPFIRGPSVYFCPDLFATSIQFWLLEVSDHLANLLAPTHQLVQIYISVISFTWSLTLYLKVLPMWRIFLYHCILRSLWVKSYSCLVLAHLPMSPQLTGFRELTMKPYCCWGKRNEALGSDAVEVWITCHCSSLCLLRLVWACSYIHSLIMECWCEQLILWLDGPGNIQFMLQMISQPLAVPWARDKSL